MSQSLPVCNFPLHFAKTNLAAHTEEGTGGFVNVRGQSRIYGSITLGGAAEYVTLEWSVDGQNVSRTKDIPQDAADPTPAFVYPIDERNLGRYVRLVYRQGVPAGAAVTRYAELYAAPESGGPTT